MLILSSRDTRLRPFASSCAMRSRKLESDGLRTTGCAPAPTCVCSCESLALKVHGSRQQPQHPQRHPLRRIPPHLITRQYRPDTTRTPVRTLTRTHQRLRIRTNRRLHLEQRRRDPDPARVVVIQKQRRRELLQLPRIQLASPSRLTQLPAPVTADRGKPVRIPIADRTPDIARFRQHAHGRDDVQRIARAEEPSSASCRDAKEPPVGAPSFGAMAFGTQSRPGGRSHRCITSPRVQTTHPDSPATTPPWCASPGRAGRYCRTRHSRGCNNGSS